MTTITTSQLTAPESSNDTISLADARMAKNEITLAASGLLDVNANPERSRLRHYHRDAIAHLSPSNLNGMKDGFVKLRHLHSIVHAHIEVGAPDVSARLSESEFNAINNLANPENYLLLRAHANQISDPHIYNEKGLEEISVRIQKALVWQVARLAKWDSELKSKAV